MNSGVRGRSLTMRAAGRKIGPLEEIKDTLDTGADAFYAKWSAHSTEVAIRYRIGPSKSDGLRFD
jgi:hypothetical protein